MDLRSTYRLITPNVATGTQEFPIYNSDTDGNMVVCLYEDRGRIFGSRLLMLLEADTSHVHLESVLTRYTELQKLNAEYHTAFLKVASETPQVVKILNLTGEHNYEAV